MNERIRELIKQSDHVTRVNYEVGNGGREIHRFDKEKFAELLIKECLDICEDVAERNDPAIACYYDIKQRLGMKS